MFPWKALLFAAFKYRNMFVLVQHICFRIFWQCKLHSFQHPAMETVARPEKLARLQELKREVPYISKSALSALLKNIKERGLPELQSRKHILESTKAALKAGERYGPLCFQLPAEKLDGSQCQLWATNFWTYMAALCYEGGSYKELLFNTCAVSGMDERHPLQLCLYCDEVIPGNILGKCERRTWAIYCSFMSFSLETLGSEYSWILLACIKSSTVSSLHAGIGQVMALILNSIFCNDLCPYDGGVLLPQKEGPSLRLYINLHAILQDGGGHKYTFNAKGDSGWKYCLLCSAHGSVVSEASEDSGEGEDVITHQTKLSQLLVPSDAEILESFDRLECNFHSMPKKDFEIWQKACGLTYSKHALLLDKQLRHNGILAPARQYCHDWMHCLVSAGIVQVAIYVLCSSIPSGWSLVHDYLQLWVWPKNVPQSVAGLFGPKQVKKYQKSKKFSCQASEALGLAPVLQYLVKSFLLPNGLLQESIGNAFLACIEILDLVHLGQIWGVCTAAALANAAERCLQAWTTAGLQNNMIKKFHWTLHLGPEFERFGKLPACFAMERKHRFICRFAASVCNTSIYEHTLLQECLAEELFHLKQPGVFTSGIHLFNGHLPTKDFHALIERTFGYQIPREYLKVAAMCKLQKSVCCKGDIVLAHPLIQWASVCFCKCLRNRKCS